MTHKHRRMYTQSKGKAGEADKPTEGACSRISIYGRYCRDPGVQEADRPCVSTCGMCVCVCATILCLFFSTRMPPLSSAEEVGALITQLKQKWGVP